MANKPQPRRHFNLASYEPTLCKVVTKQLSNEGGDKTQKQNPRYLYARPDLCRHIPFCKIVANRPPKSLRMMSCLALEAVISTKFQDVIRGRDSIGSHHVRV